MFVKSVVFFDGVPALARASRSAAQLYGMIQGSKGEYASSLTKIAQGYVNVLERAIAQSTHSHKIPEKSNWGLQPDILTVYDDGSTETSEVKNSLLDYVENARGRISVTRTRDISVGSSVNISASTKGLTVGYERDGTPITQEFSDATSFFNRYKGNTKKLKADLLKPHGNLGASHKQALSLIRANMFLKARELNIPFMVNETTLANINMRFNVEDILKFATVSMDKARDQINISFKFHSSFLRKAFSQINKNPQVRSMLDSMSTDLISKIDNEVRTASLDSLAAVLIQAENELNTLRVSMDVNYDKGSVVAYRGSVKFVQNAKNAEKAKGILDISQYVQGRVRLRMRRGAGKPRPPKIYNRTSRFKNSIEAYYDFRRKRTDYTYMPLYESLERYGYEINELVEGSIRDIVKERLNKETRVVRST